MHQKYFVNLRSAKIIKIQKGVKKKIEGEDKVMGNVSDVKRKFKIPFC